MPTIPIPADSVVAEIGTELEALESSAALSVNSNGTFNLSLTLNPSYFTYYGAAPGTNLEADQLALVLTPPFSVSLSNPVVTITRTNQNSTPSDVKFTFEVIANNVPGFASLEKQKSGN
ncbi:hypothetical protein [Foetidibacter luteolus]|uniref:hypothetical protein n=1 Tax=Foetidibacter luteolus TaxID=2608880 RepID=UPI00129A53F1|nr:hypothetical protein [Foetidibacter luteolus]